MALNLLLSMSNKAELWRYCGLSKILSNLYKNNDDWADLSTGRDEPEMKAGDFLFADGYAKPESLPATH